MNLEQMQKQLEEIQQMDMANLTSDQLNEVLEKLSTILNQSEESLINTSLIELNKTEDRSEEHTSELQSH